MIASVSIGSAWSKALATRQFSIHLLLDLRCPCTWLGASAITSSWRPMLISGQDIKNLR
jgi:hypothetical protein